MNKLYSPKEDLCAQELVKSFPKDWTISKLIFTLIPKFTWEAHPWHHTHQRSE